MINSIRYNPYPNSETYTKPAPMAVQSINPISFAASLQQRAGEATQSNVVAKLDDPSLKDPYDVNQAVNSALDNSSQRQADRQQIEDEARSFMFSAAYAQHQKAMVDQYIAVASENDSSQSSSSLKPYEVYQNMQERQDTISQAKLGAAQQVLELAVDNISLPQQPEQLPQQQVERIDIYA